MKISFVTPKEFMVLQNFVLPVSVAVVVGGGVVICSYNVGWDLIERFGLF